MTYQFPRWFRSFLIVVLIFALFPQPMAQGQSSRPQSVLINREDTQSLAWASANGAERLVDYGAFSLWRLPAAQTRALQSLPVALHPTSSQIRLRAVTLQTNQTQVEPQIAPDLSETAASGDAQLWMVQFAGPALSAWIAALQSAGLDIVAYLPDDTYVVWGQRPAERIANQPALAKLVQWQGAFHPLYRLHPDLRPGGSAIQSAAEVDVTIQLYTTAQVSSSIQQITAFSTRTYGTAATVLNLTNIHLRLPVARLNQVAAWPDVLNVEPYTAPVLMDEVQSQTLAGNITTSSGGKVAPSAPGYLAWLASKGFPTDPTQYPIIDVTDTGLDTGDAVNIKHADFRQSGNPALPSRVAFINNCTTDTSGSDVTGHGTLNAGIVAGYGLAYQDTNGYAYGLGISPYGRVAGTKIFTNSELYDTSKCGYSDTALIQNAYASGARITSDSWGETASHGVYDANAQEYDALTRDASTDAGNQEMLHVFAAGNEGQYGNMTISSPGTAKNVLTVGASENARVNCSSYSSNNADNIPIFSSRGPAADGRAKPDLVAPGTCIEGPASQAAGYNGGSVTCAMYYPANQTLYTCSNGTSHSTPAVAGAAQLTYEYYGRVLNPGKIPSPAMLKALLLNSTRYLNGNSSGGTLPGAGQGWGMADLGLLFDGTPRMMLDQSALFTQSGEVKDVYGTIQDGSKPVRVSLVWTDAPGATVGPALVNDLDLEVTVGAVIYHGNVFNGAFSAAGGVADTLNNVENVFLPPVNANEGIHVRVIAHSINGDGVPKNAYPTDQDFALVVYNATTDPAPQLSVSAVQWSELTGNSDPYVDPGETANLDFQLNNDPQGVLAQSVSAKLVVVGGQGVVLQSPSSSPDLASGAAIPLHFQVKISAGLPCGVPPGMVLQVSYQGGQAYLPVESDLPVQTYAADSVLPVTIPDNTPSGIQVPVTVNTAGSIKTLDVDVDITHAYVGDLTLSITSPGGKTVLLDQQRGGSSQNFDNVLFDDRATQSIATSSGPLIGAYQPEQTLGSFYGDAQKGIWKLNAADLEAPDVGTINTLKLKMCSLYLPDKQLLPLIGR